MPPTIEVESYETLGSAGQALRIDLDHAPGVPVRGLVALAHGFKGFARWGFLPDLGQRLAALGFPTIRPDFSHNGTGPNRGETYERLDLFEQDRVSYRRDDLAAAIQQVRMHRPELAEPPLVLGGHSLGGGLALLAAGDFDAAALFTLAAVDSFAFPKEQAQLLESDGKILVPNQRTGDLMPLGVAALHDITQHGDEYDLAARAARLDRPWLIVHGTADQTVPARAARSLAMASGGSAELLSIEGGDHTFQCKHPFGEASPQYLAVCAALERFLERALGEGAPRDEARTPLR